jgi:hypothetical protein
MADVPIVDYFDYEVTLHKIYARKVQLHEYYARFKELRYKTLAPIQVHMLANVSAFPPDFLVF